MWSFLVCTCPSLFSESEQVTLRSAGDSSAHFLARLLQWHWRFLPYQRAMLNMDQLWAPWRLAYVAKPAQSQPASSDECFLCRGIADSQDQLHQITKRSSDSIVILNRYPYNNGHLLIAPKRHVAELKELSSAELLDLQNLLIEQMELLRKLMKPDGFNVGLNVGKVAGAGLPGHLHWHIVPRWNGDTNFMPVLTDVKVIVQSLEALYDLLTSKQAG
jgi:ATP adenylyltransferase